MKRTFLLIGFLFFVISCENKYESNLENTHDEAYVAPKNEEVETDAYKNGASSDSNIIKEKSSEELSASEKASIDAYRTGYRDGEMAFGLPASETATADEVYMAYGYNFSDADIYVYRMGYEDGMYGKPQKY